MASEKVTINDQGRIVIPAAMRTALGLHGGDTLLVKLDEERGVIELATPLANLRWIQNELRKRHGDDLSRWSDEFIADRRREAAREAAKLDPLEGRALD